MRETTAANIFEVVGEENIMPSVKSQQGLDIFSANLEDQNLWKIYTKAQIIVLNKITAKSQIIDLSKSNSIFIDNLEITLKQCRQKNDNYNSENQVALTITEDKIDDDKQQIFQGWLFSSSPSISTLEHPVYEIFLKTCHD